MHLSVKKFLLRQSLRKSICLWRRILSPQERMSAAMRIVNRIMNDKRIHDARNIAVFLSFDGEIDTNPLINALWSAGKQIYLPVLHPFTNNHLLFMHYTANTPLILNRLCIREPKLDITTLMPIAGLNVLFTPLLAFDTKGHRLGMGGGFYDRILQHWWLKEGVYPIGLAYDCQQVSNLCPIDIWDVKLPEIITPSRHWRWNENEMKEKEIN